VFTVRDETKFFLYHVGKFRVSQGKIRFKIFALSSALIITITSRISKGLTFLPKNKGLYRLYKLHMRRQVSKFLRI
jgi:hypothetical protein